MLGAIELAVLTLAHRRSFAAFRAADLGTDLFCRVGRRTAAAGDARGARAQCAVGAASKTRGRSRSARCSLPPLYTERAKLPNVLVVLSESVRAEDYGIETAPETAVFPGGSISIRCARSRATPPALVLGDRHRAFTGRSARGHPAVAVDVSTSRARLVTRSERHLATIHEMSEQSEEVFEAKEMRANIDDFTTAETIMGHDPEEDDPPRAMDDVVVDTLIGRLPNLKAPVFAFSALHGHTRSLLRGSRARSVHSLRSHHGVVER